MAKIFLSGGGDISQTVRLDTEYFSLLKKEGKILYIPIAMRTDAVGYQSCHNWFSSLVAQYDHGKGLAFSMFLENDALPNLEDYDSVYIGGGNTYTLLAYFEETGLWRKLLSYIENGGLVYGGSAGAIILGKDIDTVIEENDRNYMYNRGLNLVSDYAIVCHYQEKDNPKMIEAVKKVGVDVIALSEESGLIVEDGIIRVVGSAVIWHTDGGFTVAKDSDYIKSTIR